ncbi:hypothetical protein CMV_022376 [Castanea mollissima]|uniref:PROP1-like PPR domain-containing protein n=1 Tax=Castanea mollissima TaxID=60419 RepID=A0A8J4QMC1_9ROSI|nr:hypothetical protein CMV_022376 [Castanea mollissima]
MPPQPPIPKPQNQKNKFYFFYGHRKPSQHRPTVRGGLFSNRQSISLHKPSPPHNPQPFNLHHWDPQLHSPTTTETRNTNTNTSLIRLSPIARYIIDSFRKNQNHWGPPIVSDLNKLRRVTPDLVAEVLKSQPDPNLASKFFHWASKQKGFHHTFASYNAFAYALNRSNCFRSADQLPELMISQNKPPTEKQFEILIRFHSDANRPLRVFYVYQKMKKFNVKPRVFLYNRIIDALMKNGYVDLAVSVYDDFRNDGLVEESVTFMVLIKGLCKVGRIDEMLKVLSKMRENLCTPDVFAYTAMVRVLVEARNLDGCLRVWEEMRRDKVEPDAMAYTTLVTALCKGGRVEKGYELFREMKEKRCLIDRAIYGSLVEAFVADGKVGFACGLLKDLVDSGYRADLGIYNSIIEGLCGVKQVNKAYKVFQVTIQKGLELEFVTVNPILVLYAEMRRMDEFCKLLTQMEKLGFCVIDDLSKFFAFVVGKEERTMMRTMMAVEVFEDLKKRGYCSVSIYNILMGHFIRRGSSKR